MITFEEMNEKVPKRHIIGMALETVYSTYFENGFISGAERLRAELRSHSRGLNEERF